MKINMLCQKYKQENSSTGRSIVTMCMLLPSGRKNARENSVIHDWHIFFVLSVSWNQDTQLAGKPHLYFMFPLMTLYIKSRIVGWNDTLHLVYFFQRMVQWPNLPQCSLLPFFTFQCFYSLQKSTSRIKNSCPLNKPKISGRKNLVKYLPCNQSNLSNRRFIFVFRALKLCKHSLNTFLRGT